MLGGPIAAQGVGNYLYPPLFAQLLTPLAGLSVGVAATVWLVTQGVLTYGSVWIAGTAGGLRRTPERALWTAVAVTFYLPVFDSLWKGNVSGVVAFQVALLALGGTTAGVSLASGVVLKLAPVAMLPAAAVRGRQVVVGLALAAALLVVPSVLLSPVAWRDYAVVLPNLLAGSADYVTNSAPHVLLPNFAPVLEPAAGAIRLVAIVVSGLLVAWSVLLARSDRWHAAIVAGTAAMLLLPAALWLHYLVVLLPIVALAWASASGRARAVLVAALAASAFAIAWLPLGLLGAIVVSGTALVSLSGPRRGTGC
jgi:hypothetical protein